MYRFLYFHYILWQVNCLCFTKFQKTKISPKWQNAVAAFWVWPSVNPILLQYSCHHFTPSHQTRSFIILSISTLTKTSQQLGTLTGEGVHPITHQHSVTWGPGSCGNSPCILQGKKKTQVVSSQLSRNRNRKWHRQEVTSLFGFSERSYQGHSPSNAKQN